MRVIPRSRMEGLTDGIFGTVMTVLVIDIDLPEGVKYTSNEQMLADIGNLAAPFYTYVISFFVLAMFWRGIVSMRDKRDPSGRLLTAWLFYLLVMTGIPITTKIVGNYGEFAPAVWLYATHMFLCAIAALMLAAAAHGREAHRHFSHSRVRLGILMLSAIFSVIISFFDAGLAMWAYLINVASPFISQAWEGPSVSAT
jgi:uncharacterized membrane protein